LDSLRDPKHRRTLIREIAKHDLYFLAKVILGYTWLTSPVHTDFCHEIQKGINLSLYLLPRGHCKTQIFTISGSIQTYLNRPAEPIAIVCDALKRATKKTRAIKWHLEKNQALRELFPDLVWANPFKDAPKWTDEEFIMPLHDGRQEPSFLATSLENQPTGLHFPTIKCDDIVTPETCTTRTQMDKNRDAYGLMRSSILQTGGNIQIAGTIYDDGDLHCDMSKPGTGYTIYRRPAIDPITGAALWPEQFDLEKLNSLRTDPTVGEYIFSCQYLLDPSPENDNAYFQLAWFPRYRNRPEILRIYAAIDCALSERQTADYTSIMVVGVGEGGRIYVLDVIRGRWDSYETATKMLQVQKDYKPLMWGIQKDMIIRTIGPFLKKMMIEENVILNIQDTIPMNKDKMMNGRAIQGRARQGLVILPERGVDQPEWLQPLEHEIRRFPKGEHDDQVDNLSIVGKMMEDMAGTDKKEKQYQTEAERHIDMILRRPDPEPTASMKDMMRFMPKEKETLYHDVD
jgi:predicted phage terminase large subunit-like protein